MTVPPKGESQPTENVVNKQKVKTGVVWSQWSSVLGYAVLCWYRTKVQTACDLLAGFKNSTVRSCLFSIIFLFRDSDWQWKMPRPKCSERIPSSDWCHSPYLIAELIKQEKQSRFCSTREKNNIPRRFKGGTHFWRWFFFFTKNWSNLCQIQISSSVTTTVYIWSCWPSLLPQKSTDTVPFIHHIFWVFKTLIFNS